MPDGVLQEDAVRVSDERAAHTLYNKGAFGSPQGGGGLQLSLLEAAYLAEAGRLTVRDGRRTLSPGEVVVTAAARDPQFSIRWLVYRDLRGRTLIVKEAPNHDFHVYPRKAWPGRDPARDVVVALGAGADFDAAAVVAAAGDAERLEKRLLMALVDEEGDVTYYDVERDTSSGSATNRLEDLPGQVQLVADRGLVEDDLLAQELTRGHYGRTSGPVRVLALEEVVHLVGEAGLRVVDTAGKALAAEEVLRRAREAQPDFDLRLKTYATLRERGLVPRTGFKYGTHLRAYEGDPEEGHAPYLVHALAPGRSVSWPEVAGFVRLAHGVRKTFLIGIGDDLLRLTWTRPK